MTDSVKTAIEAIAPELTATRHWLHRNPELSHQEAQTSALVAERLRALDIDVRTNVGGHGVVGTLHGAKPGRTLALRADMDALPIQEESALDYSSQNTGVMHACGHDGHTTCLLGAAHVLASHRERLSGTLRFLFQPAEETGSGAKGMCADGAMDSVDAIVALHAWPALEVGQIGIRLGAMTASADTFALTIHGKGAHAAYPHLAVDPIVAAAQVITALQTIASREVDPNQPVVVSVGQIHAGTAPNIIPDTVHLAGTVRTHSNAVRTALPAQMRRIADGICAGLRCSCELVFSEGTPPVVNDPEIARQIAEVAGEVLHPHNVVILPHASMGAEDFAVYLEHAPGALFRLGLGNPAPLHTPGFNFTDAAVPIGVEVFSRFALHFLANKMENLP